MRHPCPRPTFLRITSALLHAAALTALAALPSPGFAQQVQSDTIPLKNWALPKASDQAQSSQDALAVKSTSGLVYIAITPCRVMDTRLKGGSGKTGAFGPPSLIGGHARIVPVPSSNCGVPASAAYSLNFVSVTPLGQPVGWVAAWPDDIPWPGTVVLNAPQGGIIDNAAVVTAGADGGIQVLATNNCDLVIDLNGYYVQATTVVGPSGPQGPVGPMGPTGKTGAAGGIGQQGMTGNTGAAGPTGATGSIGPRGLVGNTGPAGPTGATGSIGPQGLLGNTGPAGATGATGPSGVLAFSDFFALMPPDNPATISVGSDIPFPQDGPTSFGGISRINTSAFLLSAIGTYQVMFQVSVSEAGQLDLTLDSTELLETVVGRATGTSQIVGIFLVNTLAPNSVLTVRNPTGSSNALTITPLAGGSTPVSAHLVISQIR